MIFWAAIWPPPFAIWTSGSDENLYNSSSLYTSFSSICPKRRYWCSKFNQNLKQRLTDVYSANWWLKTGLDPAFSRVHRIPRSHFQRSVVRGSAKILWRFWFSRGRTCSHCATRTSPCSPSPIWLILSSGVVNFHLTHSWVLSLSIFLSPLMR